MEYFSFTAAIRWWIIRLSWLFCPCWSRIYTIFHTILRFRLLNALHCTMVHSPCEVQPVIDCIAIMSQHMQPMLSVEMKVWCQIRDSIAKLSFLVELPTNSRAMMAMTTKLVVYWMHLCDETIAGKNVKCLRWVCHPLRIPAGQLYFSVIFWVFLWPECGPMQHCLLNFKEKISNWNK